VQTYKTYLKIPFVLVVARSTSKGIFVFKITMEKKCTKCGEVKSLDDFCDLKSSKDGKQFRCKICNKEYRKKNKEKIIEYKKNYYKKNKQEIQIKIKEYSNKNKESLKVYRKLYYQKNSKDIKQKVKVYKQKNPNAKKIWKENNKEKVKKSFQKWNKSQRLHNPLYRLKRRIRSNISDSLKRQGYSKNTKTYNILKCEFDFFMNWINGIASNNYTYGIGELHLDHVVPMSLAQTEDEAILLCHYSNYQLLTAKENLLKKDFYVNPLNLARVLEHHPNPDKIREIHARL